MKKTRAIWGLFGIIFLYLGIGYLYASKTPEWQTPDEPAHYNYIAQLNGEGCCPVMAPGDWDSEYLDWLKSEGFPEDADISAIEYEDHQPPLFYGISSLVFRISNGNLLAMRMFSLIISAGIIVCAYFISLTVFPVEHVFALVVSVFTAFIPQNIAIMASVNNDSMANLIASVILLLTLNYLTPFEKRGLRLKDEAYPLVLGIMLGLGFLTKLSTYSFAAVILLGILLRRSKQKFDLNKILRDSGQVIITALLTGGWWWIRNIRVYGWPDFLAQAAHDSVVVGQLRTHELIASLGFREYLTKFLTTTFKSFWGQFGWMAVPLPSGIYALIGVVVVILLFGIILNYFEARSEGKELELHVDYFWVLLGAMILVLLQYLVYNLKYVQFQGRYLYAALVPAALLLVYGANGITEKLSQLVPEQNSLLKTILMFLIVSWMPLLSIASVFLYIIPNLR